jgi:uncharacterized protein (DUF362 family)
MARRISSPSVSVLSENKAATQLTRRQLLISGGVAAAGVATSTYLARPRAAVFVARWQRYDGQLARTIRDGLIATGAHPKSIRGKRVLLKPNLVEPARDRPHMTTHPTVVAAAAEVFRSWGADVSVGEAPGHVRDTEMALWDSGMAEILAEEGLAFADLNYEAIGWRVNRGRCSKLPGFYLPQSVLEADLVVSLPKMKTHHWVGVTASMKNLYGVLPGIKYGWPKNVLHHHGIPETVVDIYASLPPTMTVVDGIDCMEGDGPIMGSVKRMGLLVVGTNLPAVDATVARIMGFDPGRIAYLRLAQGRFGSMADARIRQRGESWQSVRQPFQILDQPHLRALRSDDTGPLVS